MSFQIPIERRRRFFDVVRDIDKIENGIETIRLLKTKRNSFTPISRLSSDLLLRVFEECRYGERSPWLGFDCPMRFFWVKVTHVCQSWRSVALAACKLWAEPPLTSHRWTAEMLLRSGNAPLTTSFSGSSRQEYKSLELIYPHSKRIRSLTLDADAKIILEILSNMTSPGRVAEVLTLRTEAEERPRHNEVLDLDQYAFTKGIYHLKHLELQGFNPVWSTLRFPHLTHLEIRNCSPLRLPPMLQLLTILDTLPVLKELVLVQALPRASTWRKDLPDHMQMFVSDPDATASYDPQDVPVSFPPVALSALTHLHIEGLAREIIDFLHRIALPMTVGLNVVANCHGLLTPAAVVAAIRACRTLRMSRAVPIRSLHIVNDAVMDQDSLYRKGFGVAVQGWTTFQDQKAWWDEPLIALRFDWSTEESYNVKDAIQEALKIVHMKPEKLSLTFYGDIPKAAWKELLAPFTAIHVLKMIYGGLPELLAALQDTNTVASTADRGVRHVLLPSLQELEIRGVNFGHHPPDKNPYGGFDTGEKEKPYAPALIDALKSRVKMGRQVRQLTFTRCWDLPFSRTCLRTDTITSFEAIVPVVKVRDMNDVIDG